MTDLARSDLPPAVPAGPEAAVGFGLWPLPPADLDLDRAGPLDPAAAQVRYVVPFGEKNVLVSEVALDLLRAARAGRDVAGIGRDLGARASGPGGPAGVVSAEQVRSAYQQVLSNLPEPGGPRRNSRPGLWCVTPLLPASVVRAVAARLTGVFTPWLAWPALAVSIAAIAVALVQEGTSFAGFTPGQALAGYCVFVAIIVAHEFGHATASARGGAPPRRIGFALYLIWPSLWSDVTDSWRLPRRKRLLVDVGGVHVQLIVTGVVAAVSLAVPSHALTAAILFSLSSAVFTLNPFMRFDGYWALTDALGIPQLGNASRQAFLAAIRRSRPQDAPGGWRNAVMVGYAPLSGLVWTFFIVLIAIELPGGIEHYASLTANIDWARWTAADRHALYTTAGMVIEAIVLYRLARSGGRWIGGRVRSWRAPAPQPAAGSGPVSPMASAARPGPAAKRGGKHARRAH
jgi:putative peptide zinc metalloprotease protein